MKMLLSPNHTSSGVLLDQASAHSLEFVTSACSPLHGSQAMPGIPSGVISSVILSRDEFHCALQGNSIFTTVILVERWCL